MNWKYEKWKLEQQIRDWVKFEIPATNQNYQILVAIFVLDQNPSLYIFTELILRTKSNSKSKIKTRVRYSKACEPNY